MKREDLTVVIEAIKDQETSVHRECYSLTLHIDRKWRGKWQRLLSKSLGEVRDLEGINKIAEEEIKNLLKPAPPIQTGEYDYLEIF